MDFCRGGFKDCYWLVYHGSCLDILQREIDNSSVDCIVTSPPYWDRRAYGEKPGKDGNITKWLYSNNGKPLQGEIGNGVTYERYIDDMGVFLSLCYKVLKDNKFIFINISNMHKEFELIDVSHDIVRKAKDTGFIHWDTIIWIKQNPIPAGRYNKYYLSSGWEYVLAFTKGKRVEIDTDNYMKIKKRFKCCQCGVENEICMNITPNYFYSCCK